MQIMNNKAPKGLAVHQNLLENSFTYNVMLLPLVHYSLNKAITNSKISYENLNVQIINRC